MVEGSELMVEGSEAWRAGLMTARKSATTPETRQSTLEGQVRRCSPAAPRTRRKELARPRCHAYARPVIGIAVIPLWILAAVASDFQK